MVRGWSRQIMGGAIITLGNKFLFISVSLVFLYGLRVADADIDASFCIVSTVLKVFATD